MCVCGGVPLISRLFLCSRPLLLLIVASIIVSISFTHTYAPSLTWGSCLLSLLPLFPRTPSLSSLSQKLRYEHVPLPPNSWLLKKDDVFIRFVLLRSETGIGYRFIMAQKDQLLGTTTHHVVYAMAFFIRFYAFENKINALGWEVSLLLWYLCIYQ